MSAYLLLFDHYGPRRLTDEERMEIRNAYAGVDPSRKTWKSKTSQHAIARHYGVSQTTVYRVINELHGRGAKKTRAP